jgi:hypothetical protein
MYLTLRSGFLGSHTWGHGQPQLPHIGAAAIDAPHLAIVLPTDSLSQ